MMIKEVLLLLFCFASAVTLSVSESETAPLQLHAADESFSVGYIQMKSAENCSYLVVISTSCSSPKFTTDEIGIVFGDAYGNQVYAPRLHDPVSKTFEQCSSDSFQIDGACTSEICFAYLRRSGSSDFNGWKPESVKIFTYNTEPVTFNFNTSIPNDTWYGYNLCKTLPPPPPPPSPPHPQPPPSPTPPSSSYRLSTKNWLIYVVLAFVLSKICM